MGRHVCVTAQHVHTYTYTCVRTCLAASHFVIDSKASGVAGYVGLYELFARLAQSPSQFSMMNVLLGNDSCKYAAAVRSCA